MRARPSLLRQGILGYSLGMLAVAGALVPRAAFGAMAPGNVLCTLLVFSATLALGVIAVVVTFGLAEGRGVPLGRAAILSLTAAVPVMVASYLLTYLVAQAFPSLPILDPSEPNTVGYHLATSLGDSVPMLAAWAGLVLFPTVLRAHDDRERELLRLRYEAEVLRLRSHLEPHFVLNTLNAIAGLVSLDPIQARELLAALGDLFRDAVAFRDLHRVSDEIAWLRRYVGIHELRHGAHLQVGWEVTEAVMPLSFPALLLQPLVENALVHGALKSPTGRLTVRIAQEGAHLVAEVRDDGPGLGARRAGGQGLAIVERRLALEGDGAASFTLQREGAETVARVRIAARSQAADASSTGRP